MGKRSLNFRLAKKNRSYAVGEIAALFAVHENTVRSWQKAGLEPIDNRKPALFHGATLAEFLETRRIEAKHPLRPGEIFCLPCRAAKEPALGLVQYVPVTPTSGNLRGLCPTCERWIHRQVNRANVFNVAGSLEVTFAERPQTLEDSARPSVNSDFRKEAAS